VTVQLKIITLLEYVVLDLPSYFVFTLKNEFRNIWFEAATVVAVPPPVNISTGSVLKSALAGGLASALSTSLLHPIDSMKVQQHASLYLFHSNKLFNKVQDIQLGAFCV
jgi:hypothetical protein